MTDYRGLQTIGWVLGAATAATFLIATMLVSQAAVPAHSGFTAGYGMTASAQETP
jgi:hypothetical protein